MYSSRNTRFKVLLLLTLFALLHLYTPSLLYVADRGYDNKHIQKVQAASLPVIETPKPIIASASEDIGVAKVPAIDIYIYVNPSMTLNTPNISDDEKINRVRAFLQSKNAPLAQYASQFVQSAKVYGIDYRIAPAISVEESSGGQFNYLPYNAWGFLGHAFSNYVDSINTITSYLKTDYINIGLVTPRLIAVKYCPPNSYHWAANVTAFMEQM